MPYYCRICRRSRRSEKFSGRGHRNHICKDCQRLPRDQRDRIERMEELYGFLEQSTISRKNIARLEILAQHASSEVKDLALFILEVARVKPHKRRRWKFRFGTVSNLVRYGIILRGERYLWFSASEPSST